MAKYRIQVTQKACHILSTMLVVFRL